MVASTPPSSPSMPHSKTATSDDTSIMQRQRTVYHPVVSLMVQQNTLRDCYQIRDLYTQCTSLYAASSLDTTTDEPFVCRTAKRYHAQCLSGEKV